MHLNEKETPRPESQVNDSAEWTVVMVRSRPSNRAAADYRCSVGFVGGLPSVGVGVLQYQRRISAKMAGRARRDPATASLGAWLQKRTRHSAENADQATIERLLPEFAAERDERARDYRELFAVLEDVLRT